MDSQVTGENVPNIAVEREKEFTIGQLTHAVGALTDIPCTSAMIYNYERMGLIEAPERTEGGFRLFTLEDVGRVAYIKRRQAEGMSLDEIGHRLENCDEKFENVGESLTMPADRRTQILQTATQAFLAEGYASTTLSDIAETADISSAAIYRYFSSKEELFLATVEHFSFRDVLEQVRYVLQELEIRNGEDVYQVLVDIGQAFLEIYADNRDLHNMFIIESRSFPEAGKHYYRRFVEPVLSLVEEFVAVSIEKGVMRNIDPKLAVQAFYGLLFTYQVTQELLNGGERPILTEPDWIEEVVGIYLEGVMQPQS